jgi:hypothetical protein
MSDSAPRDPAGKLKKDAHEGKKGGDLSKVKSADAKKSSPVK